MVTFYDSQQLSYQFVLDSSATRSSTPSEKQCRIISEREAGDRERRGRVSSVFGAGHRKVILGRQEDYGKLHKLCICIVV